VYNFHRIKTSQPKLQYVTGIINHGEVAGECNIGLTLCKPHSLRQHFQETTKEKTQTCSFSKVGQRFGCQGNKLLTKWREVCEHPTRNLPTQENLCPNILLTQEPRNIFKQKNTKGTLALRLRPHRKRQFLLQIALIFLGTK